MGIAPPLPAVPPFLSLPLPAAVGGVITLAFASNPQIAKTYYEGVIAANVTIAISGGIEGQEMTFAIVQNSVGGWMIGLPGPPNIRWAGAPGGAPTPIPATAPNARNVFKVTATATQNSYDGSY